MVRKDTDQEKIIQLYQQYAPRMLAWARRYLPEPDAEDIVHDAFLYLMKLSPEKRDPDCPKTARLCFILTKSLCLNHLRDHKRELLTDFEAEEARWMESDMPSYGETGRIRDADWGKAFMDRLPSRYRDILILRYEDELSTKEIAILMNLSAATVNRVLSRAREAARKIIEAEQ